MSDKDRIADALERFKLAYDAESANRENALDDIRFARLGEQWPANVLAERDRDGRPALTINKLPAIARQVINDARQNKPSIKVRPADSYADVKTAGIYNGLIRNIESQSNADVAYDTAVEAAVYGGFGYFRIKTDYAHDDSFDLDICIERVANTFTVYGYPFSQCADASDWEWAFVSELIPEAEFKRRYPSADKVDWDAPGDDKTRLWFDDKSARIAEDWKREPYKRKIVKLSSGLILPADQYMEPQRRAVFDAMGLQVVGDRETQSYKVTQTIMSGAQELERNDWPGRFIPICPVYGEEVNIEGERVFRSLIRDAKDPQKMFNYWRTTSTELVALQPRAPWVGEEGSFTDTRWETANTQNHPTLEYKKGAPPPQRQPFAGIPAGALQEAMNAADDIKAVTGIYDASLGARSNETSGRAIVARQREGDVGTFHFIDNLTRAIRYAGRVLIDLIPSVYTGDRMVRVLGEDGKEDIVSIGNGVIDLARGKYDLVVNAGPSFTTRREEAATQMVEMTRANPAVAPLVMDKLAKNLDWPEADAIAKRFAAMLPPQIQALEQQDGQDPAALAAKLAQAVQQIQQMQQALQQAQQQLQANGADAQAKVQTAQIQAALDKEVAQLKAATERDVEAFKARLKAETEIMVAQIRAGTGAPIPQPPFQPQ